MAINDGDQKVNILIKVDRGRFERNKVVFGECTLPKDEKNVRTVTKSGDNHHTWKF